MTTTKKEKRTDFFASPYWIAFVGGTAASLVVAFIWSFITTLLNGTYTQVKFSGHTHQYYQHHYAVPSQHVWLVLAVGYGFGVLLGWSSTK